MAERKIYPSLDIMKFIMAMLILTQHTSNEWAHSTGLVHAFFGLGNFAVPFFFTCSGFLFFSKLNKIETSGGAKKLIIRNGRCELARCILCGHSFTFVSYSLGGVQKALVSTS